MRPQASDDAQPTSSTRKSHILAGPLSYALGAASPPLMEITIGEALERAAALWPQKMAIVSVHQNRRMSWSQLDLEANRIASGLLKRGVVKGDRVGIWAPNCAEWTILQFATAKIGAILVTINPAYRAAEVEYALRKVGCTALVTAAAFKSSDYIRMLRSIDRPESLDLLVSLGSQHHDGFLPWSELGEPADMGILSAIAAQLGAGDAINIQFTSGTTGAPKGATLSHRNILNNGQFVGQAIALRPEDSICIAVPLYHCFGMVMGNLAAVTSGATMVYPGEGFGAAATLDAIEAERCTALYAVPTMFIAMLEQLDRAPRDLSSLRTGITAGSLCAAPVMRAVMETLHMPEVTNAYGMTETSPVSLQTAIDDPLDDRVLTVGRVQPHLEAKIVGPDGELTPIGEQGEYCIRGYSVMLGYWDEPEKTAESIDGEGWMHSGDLATMDDRGYVRITGRIKDMIIRGGENIYPREIEDFLIRHPAISDAQVFGIADDKFGEEICAWIVTKPGWTIETEEIRAFCRASIAHYKVPRFVKVVDQFILTVTGKPQKVAMRKAMEAELGRQV